MAVANLLVVIAGALIIRAVFHAQYGLAESLGFGIPSVGWRCAYLALTCPVGLLIHELGHFLAGAAAAQHCLSFGIGPVALSRNVQGWTIRFIPLRHAAVVNLVPSTFAHFRLQRAFCAAGGPVASLLTGMAFGGLAMHAHSASLFWFWSFSVQWAVVGLMGLVPFRAGTARSDGFLLWEVIRGGRACDEVERGLLTASSDATPLRVREWPRDLIRRLGEAPGDPASRRYNFYLAYIHFLDSGDVQTAGQYMDRAVADGTTGEAAEFAMEAAYFWAFHRQDPDTARQWLDRENRDAPPWVRRRAQAAIDRASSNPARARAQVTEALAALKAQPACGSHQYEVDRLQEILRDLDHVPDDVAGDRE
ncbi:MAG: site-2 protease family protein [Bryobacteraceae bacterium]